MANHAVMGRYICPFCQHNMVVSWDGNHLTRCPKCERRFTVKRQRIKGAKLVSKVRKDVFEK